MYYEKANEFIALELILRNIAIKYNYFEIITPIFEVKDLFLHSIDIEKDLFNKEMFELFDKKKDYLFYVQKELYPLFVVLLKIKYTKNMNYH